MCIHDMSEGDVANRSALTPDILAITLEFLATSGIARSHILLLYPRSTSIVIVVVVVVVVVDAHAIATDVRHQLLAADKWGRH